MDQILALYLAYGAVIAMLGGWAIRLVLGCRNELELDPDNLDPCEREPGKPGSR